MIRREDDDVSFDATYDEFKGVIGSESSGSYWMGLDAMHALTSPCPALVRIEQVDASGTQHFVYYRNVYVNSLSEGYRARFTGRSTDFPSEYEYQSHCNSLGNNMSAFSARDHSGLGPSSPNRAVGSLAGWWWSASGGNTLTKPFSQLQCSSALFPDLIKLEMLILSRDAQDCYY